jgi:hypothetical protein
MVDFIIYLKKVSQIDSEEGNEETIVEDAIHKLRAETIEKELQYQQKL